MGATSPQYHSTPQPDGDRSPSGSAALAEAGEPYALIDQLPGAVLLLDPTGRVVHLNGIAELRLDVVRREAQGRDLFRELLPDLERQGVGDQYRGAMLGGRASLAAEVTLDPAPGPRRLGLGIRSFVHQGVLGALVLVEDRSALAVEEERRRRSEQLAAVGSLATGVAHEINNPLASIKGFAQLLTRDATDESQAQGLVIISQESTRVARIVDRLLDFADQQRSTSTEAVGLSALVDGVLDLRQYALETAGIEVERDLDPELSPVRANPGALQRVVLGVLRQAERSIASQDRARRVTARTRESTDGVVLYLTDTGAGFGRDRLRTLFSTPDPDDRGDGLELATAAETVRAQGGQLWADSVLGEGTTYVIRLPRHEEPSAPAQQRGETAPVRSFASRSLRVLVADDEPTLRLAIALFLGRHGHEVVQAADAYEAHRIALEEPFDVVIADARMPGDGVALLEKLEAIPRLQGRTILMTGEHIATLSNGELEKRPHLSKPFDLTEVIRLVESLGR